MSNSQYLQYKLSFFKRLQAKKEAIRTVLRAPRLHNHELVTIHRIDPTNAGDFYCAPHHYFEALKNTGLDIFDYKKEDSETRNRWSQQIIDNALIIGGGGLLCHSAFHRQMKLFEKLKPRGKKTVLWGVGHNSPHRRHFNRIQKYNIDTAAFGLAGVRDYDMGAEWVPCVSCLHPIFDEPRDEIREIGIVFHKKTLRNRTITNIFQGIPSIANHAPFEEMVRFIKESHIVLTSSYHAMYWALLLGKKVLVFPNSSKFFNFKYPPVISHPHRYKTDLKKAQSYSGVLEECRGINLTFADKVFDYLTV